MARVTRRHKIVRILFLIAAAIAWMGPPRPAAGSRGRRVRRCRSTRRRRPAPTRRT